MKTKWYELKGYQYMITKVDRFDSSALSQLYDNSCRMCNESNSNVSVATASPDVWFDDVVELIIENVSYISKNNNFQFIIYDKPNLKFVEYSCEFKEFQSIDDMKDFIQEKGQLSLFVLFSIVKYVNLDTLSVSWGVRYKEVLDNQQIRDNKIEYLIKQ